jgi:hypothetical protein
MYLKWEMSLSRNIVLRTCMEIYAVWAVAPTCWNLSKSCWWGCNSLQKCFEHDFLPLYIHSYCTLLDILKEIRTNTAMRINCIPHCQLCTMQRMVVNFVWVAWSPVATVLFIHTPDTSDISNAFTLSLLFLTRYKNSLQNCSRLTLTRSLSSWATCNLGFVWMVMQILVEN